jgi:hypothetical protein
VVASERCLVFLFDVFQRVFSRKVGARSLVIGASIRGRSWGTWVESCIGNLGGRRLFLWMARGGGYKGCSCLNRQKFLLFSSRVASLSARGILLGGVVLFFLLALESCFIVYFFYSSVSHRPLLALAWSGLVWFGSDCNSRPLTSPYFRSSSKWGFVCLFARSLGFWGGERK